MLDSTIIEVYSATDTYEVVCYVVSSKFPTITWNTVPPTDQLNYSSTMFDGTQYSSILYVNVHTGGDRYICSAANEGGKRFGYLQKLIKGIVVLFKSLKILVL